MAMPVSVAKPIVGVDVAKDELVIYHAQTDRLEAIPNTKAAIKKWLKELPAPVDVAIEATNIYHQEFADLAYAQGCVISHMDSDVTAGFASSRSHPVESFLAATGSTFNEPQPPALPSSCAGSTGACRSRLLRCRPGSPS